MTFSSILTGDEKPVGPYQARRIKTTITVEPSRGAATSPAKVEADGWYLDIRGLNCLEQPARPHLWQPPRYGPDDRIVIKRNGPEPEGLLVEGKSVTTQGGNVVVDKTEILKVSEEPLDDSLFELPPGYSRVTLGHPQIRGSTTDP